jgi:rhodanese-related sulfurtransferase
VKWSDHPLSRASASQSVDPRDVWAAMQRGEATLLDLRTNVERSRYGTPPGAVHVSLFRHTLHPSGPPAVYLCQHAVRSKLTLRRGAAEVAGGFARWREEGLPVED